jgi:glycerophosphoryl diester phosphodiesterase
MDPKSGRSNGVVSRRTVLTGAGAAAGAATLGTVASGGGSSGSAGNDESETNGKENGATDGDREGTGFAGDDDPIVIGHRGFAGVYPENTVASAVGAGLAGAEAIEIDVVPTADGTVVVFHDDRLSGRESGGLTDTEGLIWETDTETVLDAEVLDSGETIPTLERLFEAIPAGLGVNVELKNPGSSEVIVSEDLEDETLATQKELWRPFVDRALDIAAEYENEILVSSFSEAAIAVTREYDSSIPVAYLLWDSIERGLEIVREYDCEAIHPPYDMVQGSPFFDDGVYLDDPDYGDIDIVDVAHEEGRAVNVYTVGTWYQAEQLAAAGVDGLINDYPGLLTASDPGN